MSKGQRGNKEVKKPKQAKTPAPIAANPGTPAGPSTPRPAPAGTGPRK